MNSITVHSDRAPASLIAADILLVSTSLKAEAVSNRFGGMTAIRGKAAGSIRAVPAGAPDPVRSESWKGNRCCKERRPPILIARDLYRVAAATCREFAPGNPTSNERSTPIIGLPASKEIHAKLTT